MQHHDDEAAAEYQKAVAADPKDLRALKRLAWLRATSPAALLRDGDQAVALAQRANALSGGKLPEVLEVLAAAYAEVGRFDDALSTAKQAVELAQRKKNEPLADALRAQLSRYREGLAFRHVERISSPSEPVVSSKPRSWWGFGRGNSASLATKG